MKIGKFELEGRNGIGTGFFLSLALAALKAFGLVSWSWVWVLAPFVAPVAFALLLVAIVLIRGAVMGELEVRVRRDGR